MNFPGSTVKADEKTGKRFLDGLFVGTKGLVMSQIRELTGLSNHNVQNWVNRGFIPRPVGKKYDEDMVARILIINALKDTMSLDDIAKLLYFVNGDAADKSDDIISESVLYGYVCELFGQKVGDGDVSDTVKEITKDFTGKSAADKERLDTALKIIYFHSRAKRYIERAEELLQNAES